MEQFMRKFTQLNGVKARVILEHRLFDRQVFDCDELKIINDDERIGVLLKGQEKYLYKQDVKVVEIPDNTYMISDGRMSIVIKCK